MRKPPTKETIKRLFALSGNRCAFPECTETLVKPDGTIVAEICHIEAANEGGERYNSGQTDEERRALRNLVLLCRNHHKITNNVDVYTVGVMQKYKRDHEASFLGNEYAVTDEVVTQMLKNCTLIINTDVSTQALFQGGSHTHNYYGSEKADLGIIDEIFNYISTSNTNGVTIDLKNENNRLTSLSNKLTLNFGGDHLVTMKEMMSQLWQHKELVESFFKKQEEYDSLRVKALVDKIQSDFRTLKKSATHHCEIADANVIHQLALSYLPEDKKICPDYVAVSKAIVLYLFELCDLGKKMSDEKTKPTLFDKLC
ncbi:MAG: hypothetical protein EHM20_06635 [Alphaproteobacteria bacterium]|nr:MAG: hypothetical protein EHM20_06635 [Alphaproteobacteria bacterium]